MLIKQLAAGICIVGCMCVLQINRTEAQTSTDTVRLSLQEAEKMFLDKNLTLLASNYNIQSNEALVEQARKWDNPVLNTDQNVYSNNKFFEHTTDAAGNPQGQVFVQLQQLIRTAGKRSKQIGLAQTNVHVAEWQFKDVLRSLRTTLILDFYTIAQLQGNAQLYNTNNKQLETLLNGMSAQLQAGNIAKKEYLRVQALLINVQQELTENAKALNDLQAELKTMLQITGDTYIMPVVATADMNDVASISVPRLMDTARRYNPDYQLQVYQLLYQQKNYSLQKSLAVPDLTLAPSYDQNSNYTPNYWGLGISLPIPLWDRNRGNIKAANYQVKQEEALTQQADQKLQNDVLNAYQKLLYTEKLNSSMNQNFYKEYYQLYSNIIESYNKRQISLLEFLNYFSDYESTREQELQQNLNMHLAKLALNDAVGIDVVTQ